MPLLFEHDRSHTLGPCSCPRASSAAPTRKQDNSLLHRVEHISVTGASRFLLFDSDLRSCGPNLPDPSGNFVPDVTESDSRRNNDRTTRRRVAPATTAETSPIVEPSRS